MNQIQRNNKMILKNETVNWSKTINQWNDLEQKNTVNNDLKQWKTIIIWSRAIEPSKSSRTMKHSQNDLEINMLDTLT